MTIQFPPEFQTYWKMPGTKTAFVSEIQPKRPADCGNCGGVGTMVTFCARQGPFDNVPVGASVVAHYANGKWWGGSNFSASCPVCKGTGRNPQHKESPIRMNPIQAKLALESLKNMNTGQTESIEDSTRMSEMIG